MLLNVKTRQLYLKELGLYSGEIDGHAGILTKKSYRDLQNKYFTREKDKDGLYGNDTDILLRSVHNFIGIKNFKPEELKCKCNGLCTGYPAVIDKNLLINMQNVREHYGKSITITSGLRCTAYNKKVGGSTGSSHTKGKASDIYIAGGQSNTHKGRVEIVNYWDTLDNSKYAYCNGYMKYKDKTPIVYNSKTMGNATYLNVK